MPCAHFSILPSAPQAVRTRNNGMVKPLRPGMDPAISWRSPIMPLGVVPGGNAGTLESQPVSKAADETNRSLFAIEEIADCFSERAIDLAQRRRFAARTDEATDEIKDLLQLRGLILRRRSKSVVVDLGAVMLIFCRIFATCCRVLVRSFAGTGIVG